jgi:hypothetical protein
LSISFFPKGTLKLKGIETRLLVSHFQKLYLKITFRSMEKEKKRCEWEKFGWLSKLRISNLAPSGSRCTCSPSFILKNARRKAGNAKEEHKARGIVHNDSKRYKARVVGGEEPR